MRVRASSIYRRVSITMWGDAKFSTLTPLPPSGQSLWLWLITGPKTTALPGLLLGRGAALAEEIGWTTKAFEQAFGEVLALGMAVREEGVIWLRRGLAHNPPASPNVVRGWRSTWQLVPELSVRGVIYEDISQFLETFGKGFRVAFKEAFGEAFRQSGIRKQESGSRKQEAGRHSGATRTGGLFGDPPPQDGPANGTPKKAKKARPEPVYHPDYKRALDGFHDAFRAARDGAKPTWDGRRQAAINRLVEQHGADEVLRRAANMFKLGRAGTWPATNGGDLDTLARHFDALATTGPKTADDVLDEAFADFSEDGDA